MNCIHHRYIAYFCLIVYSLTITNSANAAQLSNNKTITPSNINHYLSEVPAETYKNILWDIPHGQLNEYDKICKTFLNVRSTNKILYHKVGQVLEYIPDACSLTPTRLYVNHCYGNRVTEKVAQKQCFFISQFPKNDLKLLSILVLYVDIGTKKGDWGDSDDNTILFNLIKSDLYNMHHFKNLLLKHTSRITWTLRDIEMIGNQIYTLELKESINPEEKLIRCRKAYTQLLEKIIPLNNTPSKQAYITC